MAKTLTATEIVEQFEKASLETQIQIFKDIKSILEEKERIAQDDLQKLSTVTDK